MTVETINDNNFETDRDYFKSIAGNPTLGRVGGSVFFSKNQPVLKEFIKDSFTGGVKTITFQKSYKTAPLVDGVAKKPNGDVVKLPHGDRTTGDGDGGDAFTNAGAVWLSNITKESVIINMDGDTGRTYFIIRIYDVLKALE